MLEDSAKTEGEKAEELNALQSTLLNATITQDKLLKGYTAYIGGEIKEGTMEDYAGQTVNATKVKENESNMEITIPETGYYNTNSKVTIPVDNSTRFGEYLIENGIIKSGLSYKGDGVLEGSSLYFTSDFEFTVDVTNIYKICVVAGSSNHGNNSIYYPHIFLNGKEEFNNYVDVSKLTGNVTIKITAFGGNERSFSIFDIYTK